MSENKKSIKDILQNPKGMRDFFGENFNAKKKFYILAETMAEYNGFKGIELPILEHTEVFTKGVGDITDIIEKEMYTLETKGGDSLALRPEGTAGIMRSYIEHGMGSLPQPVSVYYGGPFFRHEKPQKGRYRQFYQFGLEIMGSQNLLYDGHIIQTGFSIIKEYTNKDIRIKLNTLGNTSSRKAYLEKLTSFYTENISKISEKDVIRLKTNPLRILDSKETETLELNKNAPSVLDSLDTESLESFEIVKKYLDDHSIPYELDTKLVRGLDYYSHTVFEYVVYDEDGNPSFALGGGGRYDGLARVMGHTKDVPAVGLGLGVDRILEITDTENIDYSQTYALIELGVQAQTYSEPITKILRELNIPITRVSQKNKLGEHLGIIENLSIPYAIIIGEDEIHKQTVLVKNMQTHQQDTVLITDLKNYFIKK